ALAAELKRRIESGELPPGALLPTETDLERETGHSRTTVRDAIKDLKRQGLVVTVQGRGTSVRERRPPQRRTMSRYLADADPKGSQVAFTGEQRISGSDSTVDRDYLVVPANARHAELLDIPEGADVLERHFTFRSKGSAIELVTSCYPYELVKGTRVADPVNEPWPGGNIAQLRTLGVAVTRVTEEVASRPPTGEEVKTFGPLLGDSVIAIVRRMFADDRPVELADIILPAEGMTLAYEIVIPRPE
ncbi:MAG: GntR family transcriptional regulator, partial [Micromonosporaceae bacterium]